MPSRGEFSERVAGRAFGRFEYDLRVSTIQCAMPKDGGNQIWGPLVVDGVRNKAPVAPIQNAKVKELRGTRNLLERHLQEPFAEHPQCRLGQIPTPVAASASRAVR